MNMFGPGPQGQQIPPQQPQQPPVGLPGPPPPGAGVPPQLPPVQPLMGQHLPLMPSTYFQFFSVMANDPHSGDYGYNQGDFEVIAAGSRFTSATLAARVAAASCNDVPMAMLGHIRNTQLPDDIGHLMVFHRITTYPITTVGPPQPWDGNTYALYGDVMNQHYAVVPFQPANLNPLPNSVWVLSDADALAVCIQTPTGLFPHVAANTAGAEEVLTRRTMWVPFLFVHLFLLTPLTPKEAFVRVHAWATTMNANVLGSIRTLLDFLKVAATATANDAALSEVTQTPPLLANIPNLALTNFFDRMVNRDLPARRGSDPALVPRFNSQELSMPLKR